MTSRSAKDLRRRHVTTAADKLTAHRGMATWGERLVPLESFRTASAVAGRTLSGSERRRATREFLKVSSDPSPVEGPFSRIVVFGGVYNNRWGLEALLEKETSAAAEAFYCLGDLGGFGPRPEEIWPLIRDAGVRTIQGNYEESLATGAEDCNCGYTDPRDNYFAELSYSYTAGNCSREFKRWMGELPRRRRVKVGDKELLLVHGSPRRVNEFLFHSTTSVPYLEVLLDQEGCDGFLCTHTGLSWHRQLPSGRDIINVGVIGRPANDGSTDVWYTVVEDHDGSLAVRLEPLRYDHQGLAQAMRHEGLPEEFVETVLTGWWTTCLEILPARERFVSHF